MPNVLNLRRSTDRKTTPSASASGKSANIANAFGLLSGRDYSCPGQTAACEAVCYAGRLERIFGGFRNAMAHNYEALSNASFSDMVKSLHAIIGDFRKDADKRGCDKVFRIHHDGDFFSREYAAAWAMVCRMNPDITFWAYTRSFLPGCNVVDILADIPNLTLYLSADADNMEWAEIVAAEWPSVNVATLTDTFEDGKAVMASIGRTRPGAACPEVKGALPLIDKNGGACVTCGLCVFGKADIRFASKGR